VAVSILSVYLIVIALAVTVGDCEVGATRKACKNCTCGRAEAEQKVEKLGLTAEQLNNPESACGNVRIVVFNWARLLNNFVTFWRVFFNFIFSPFIFKAQLHV